MNGSVKVYNDEFSSIEFGSSGLCLFIEGDSILVYCSAEREHIMQFPNQGVGPKRILGRMQRNAEMMEVVDGNAETVAGLINEARLEMMRLARN